MGKRRQVQSTDLADKCRQERFSENSKVLKIAPLVIIFVSVLYLLQYRFFPGREVASIYHRNYVFQFYFAIIVSSLFRILLPIVLKAFKKSYKVSLFFGIYYYAMFVFCINLTVLDMQISQDYSAYAVGLFMIAYLYRIDWKKYFIFSVSGILLFFNASFFGFNNLITVDKLLPLVIFTGLSIYIVYNRETLRIHILSLAVKLEESALKDHLTGLYNRRFLFDFLSTRFALFNRYGAVTTILIIDIDHFKKINDKLGHNVGDLVLKSFSDLILKTIRDTDQAFRYGGEEFIIVLSDTSLNNALVLAERLRKSIEGFAFPEVPWTVTASAGLAEMRAGENDDELIERADKNLYEAKRRGRNQVVK